MSYEGEERRKSHIDLIERITVLETKHEAQQALLSTISTNVADIKGEMTKYKGMLGGGLFVVSCIVTALSLAKDWLLGKHN